VAQSPPAVIYFPHRRGRLCHTYFPSRLPVCLISAWIFVCLPVQFGRHNANAQDNISTSGEFTKYAVIERNREGIPICQVAGDRAKKRPDGKFEIWSVLVNTFRGQQVDWNLSTPHCILSEKVNEKTKQTEREAVSEADVRIFNNKIEITGTGFHWLVDECQFIVRNRVRVTVRGGITGGASS